VHPVLSTASSKRPSGVAAELEWDLVAELGDAAMAEAFGVLGPAMPQASLFPTMADPDRRENCIEGPLFL